MDQHEPFVGTQEVADCLGVPPATVAQWRYRGLGPQGYRVGRFVKYRMSEVVAWVESQADRELVR